MAAQLYVERQPLDSRRDADERRQTRVGNAIESNAEKKVFL